MSLSSLEIISVGGSFMEDSLGSYLDERDPRKRKRSEDMHSPSRIRSDNWAQRAEAFIHKVKDPPLGGHSPNAGGANNNVSDGRVREGGGFGSSSYGYTGGGSGVVVGYPSAFSANPPPGYPSRGTAGSNPPSSSFNSHYNNKVSGDSKDGGAMVHSGGGVNHQKRKSNKRRSRDESSSSSSESESEEESQVPSDQKSKLRIQKDQYEKAQEKLEAQLIKLKEQREALKEGGARHEDKIMKDNARLQKEVKNRLTHMSDVLDKISLGLDTLPIQEEENKPLRRKSSSRERSVSKKKKKRQRHRGKSPLSDEYEEDDSEREAKKRHHRKKKRKYRTSSSSEDSDSEAEGKKSKKSNSKVKHHQGDGLPLDDSIFRMMSDLKQFKSSSKKGEDTTFMDLLGKMSEAYMKAKQEVNELSHRINALESENQLLKKQLEETVTQKEEAKKWDAKVSHIIEVMEPKRRKKGGGEDVVPLPPSEGGLKRRTSEDTSRSVRAKMIEQEERAASSKKNGGNESERSVSRERRSKSRERRSKSRDYHRPPRRDYSPEPRRRRNRRSRSREPRRSRSKGRNDRINLEDWAEKPDLERDPSLMSLKEKMISKERTIVEKKTQWAAVAQAKSPEPPKESTGPADQQAAAAIVRPQVAIQWGQGVKRPTPEPAVQGRRSQPPLVGKMPCGKGGTKKPAESRFGPPANNSNIPPPGVLSSVPTPLGLETAPPLPKKNPPKNPTPTAMDMGAMLAAAKAHMRARSEEFVPPEMEIPLPPLPAATDKDPMALTDTRPPKIDTPPPPKPKSEMEIMIEKHCPGATLDYAPPTPFDLHPGENEDMDPSELAMLGIDPSDLAGFGN